MAKQRIASENSCSHPFERTPVTLKTSETHHRTLVIACGAVAREIAFLIEANGWSGFTVHSIPAEFHNTPERIADAVRARIEEVRGEFDQIFCAYADCGTRGQLDALLEEEGVARLPGAHCYQFFAGEALFGRLTDEEPGTFYLTDFLVEHFDRLVIGGLGLDRHPELHDEYFKNYKRVVYLSQREEPGEWLERARRAAQRLSLEFEHHVTGYGELEHSLKRLAAARDDGYGSR